MAGECPNCFMPILIPVALIRPQHKNYLFHQAKHVDLHHTDKALSFTLQLLYSWEQTLVPMKWREGRMVPRAGMNVLGEKEI
jgi:hypothetical protein